MGPVVITPLKAYMMVNGEWVEIDIDEELREFDICGQMEGMWVSGLCEAVRKAGETVADYLWEKVMEAINAVRRDMAAERELEEPAAMKEKGAWLDVPNPWDRREARRAAERAGSACFSRCKARELAWVRRKRTRPRQREYRGPDLL